MRHAVRFHASDIVLCQLGFELVGEDPAAYRPQIDGRIEAILRVRADNGTLSRPVVGRGRARAYGERFSAGEFTTDDFVCTGARVAPHEDGSISMSRSDCVHRLAEIELEKSRFSARFLALDTAGRGGAATGPIFGRTYVVRRADGTGY